MWTFCKDDVQFIRLNDGRLDVVVGAEKERLTGHHARLLGVSLRNSKLWDHPVFPRLKVARLGSKLRVRVGSALAHVDLSEDDISRLFDVTDSMNRIRRFM